MKIKFLIFTILLSFTLVCEAQIKVASVLGDNMVLQRNSEVKIWGTSTPNSKLTVFVDWNKSKVNTVCNDKGEWLVNVKTTDAGGPYTISISDSKEKLKLNNILLGEVWLCSGQSNMEMPMLGFTNSPVNGSNEAIFDADNDNIRLFTVKKRSKTTPENSCEGNWSTANSESVSQFSAVGYFYALQLYKKLHVPIGVVCSSWGGSRIEAWMDNESLGKFPEELQTTAKKNPVIPQRASVLYNGMIHPLRNYVFKGIVWYQGESNRDSYQYYAHLMTSMVENWRTVFNNSELPFYYVQIAPHGYDKSTDILSGRFYEEQQKAGKKIPNSGMVCTVDLGEEKNIHPAEKETISKRLANWAVSKTYGMKGISFENTSYKESFVKDSSMVVLFNNETLGFTFHGKEISNFEIAGEDKVFYPAKVDINTSRRITVSAKEVTKPVSVRYCFRNFPQGDGFLYNTAGLPVLPFRTDNW